MPFADLRDFLDELEKQQELVRVSAEVDVRYEIGAICRKVSDAYGPALFFERPRGYSNPVVMNVLGTKERLGLALGCEPDALLRVWNERTKHPIEPTLVSTGPCKENVLLGSDVDLGRFPIPTLNELDGGPYIDLPSIISRDPETGIRNSAMYRLQVQGKRTLGVLAASYRHLTMQRRKVSGPFPVAIAVGLDPVVTMATVGPFAFGVDELAMAGALRGEPVPLVRCETVPLEVPAHAEIVLEGEIHRGETAEEGPFGEFTGFYGPKGQRTVIRIKAITFRNDLILQGAYCGRPPQETNLIYSFSIAAGVANSVPLPGLKQINVNQSGFNAIVSIEKPCEGYGKMMGLAILGTWAGRMLKTVILVDEDIDPFNWD
ncbi:MAG: UbiD family decarboxylase, partial [Candidatus Tectomicrobia bacterium]|nr:UbiD family decarboxylase [Candidatus Tectomicrobia bacterium]